MLKQLTAFIFLLTFLFQTFTKAFIIIEYYTNTPSFVLNCENKTAPTMHCNGKCQMRKKLKQEDKKEEQNPERRAESKTDLLFSPKSFFSAICSPESTIVLKDYAQLHSKRELTFPRTIFRPPIIAVL